MRGSRGSLAQGCSSNGPGARYKSGSNISIAVTGIAGPSGSSEDKEVGRVHVAVIAEDYFLVEEWISETTIVSITSVHSLRSL